MSIQMFGFCDFYFVFLFYHNICCMSIVYATTSSVLNRIFIFKKQIFSTKTTKILFVSAFVSHKFLLAEVTIPLSILCKTPLILSARKITTSYLSPPESEFCFVTVRCYGYSLTSLVSNKTPLRVIFSDLFTDFSTLSSAFLKQKTAGTCPAIYLYICNSIIIMRKQSLIQISNGVIFVYDIGTSNKTLFRQLMF